MPMLIPIAAAAGSIFAGATAIGAGAALVGGAMIAGGALTAIGAVTKNNKLMKIGGLVSLAGGVAGLATGAWASTASTLADQSAMAAQEGFRASEILASNAAGAAGSTGANIADAGMVYQNALAGSSAAPSNGCAGRSTDGRTNRANCSKQRAGTPNVASSIGDTISGVGKWMGANKELVNTGAGIIGGAMKNASEQDMLAEKWKQEDEAIARKRQQLSASILGLQMPTYVPPTYTPQNYAPGTYAPKSYAPTVYAPNQPVKG